MAGMKTLFVGSPKPKKDKEQEKMLAEQLANEKKRGEASDRALMSARRARNAQGGGRSGLAYVKPAQGQSASLG